jgi:hypothetical protein
VPQLFTQWWLTWNECNPLKFPLPGALASLGEPEKTTYLSRGLLDAKVDTAAETIWESYQSEIEIMLYIYHMRPIERNSIQHPDPSTTAAYKFLKDLKSYHSMTVTKEQNTMIEAVIESGTRWSFSGEKIQLFSHNTVNTPQASPGPSTGITRQREEDDQDHEGSIPMKKRRIEE